MTINKARNLLHALADNAHILLFSLLLVTVGLGSMRYSAPVATSPKVAQNSSHSYDLSTDPTKDANGAGTSLSVSKPSSGSESPYKAQDNESQQSTSSLDATDTPPMPAAAPSSNSLLRCTQCPALVNCSDECPPQPSPTPPYPPCPRCDSFDALHHSGVAIMCPMYMCANGL
jgi:hypothetical protein